MKKSDSPTFQRNGINNILLVQLGDIGDVVLTFPCIRALRENFPEAQIAVAVREKARELIDDCTWADVTIFVDQKKRGVLEQFLYQVRFLRKLRSFQFDLCIDMRTGDRGAILALLSGASLRIGYYEENGNCWRNKVFTHLSHIGYTPDQYVGDYLLSLLVAYGFGTENIQPEMKVTYHREKEAESLLTTEMLQPHDPFVALQPFSLWEYKEWGTEKFARLIDWIQERYHLPVVLIGTAFEKERSFEITEKCTHPAVNLMGKTSIGALSAVIKQAKLFIGVDSVGVHMAGAVGTPSVTIFGPSSPVSWAPRGPKHLVIQKDMPCVPCRQKGCEGSEISHCLIDLQVEEVAQAVEQQLETHLTRAPVKQQQKGFTGQAETQRMKGTFPQ